MSTEKKSGDYLKEKLPKLVQARATAYQFAYEHPECSERIRHYIKSLNILISEFREALGFQEVEQDRVLINIFNGTILCEGGSDE